MSPDSHAGLAGVLLVGVNWVVAVDDVTTPWAIGVAASTAVFHTSMSASSVSPASARWTAAMRRRWGRRALALTASTAPCWMVVAVVAEVELDGSAVLLAAALAAIAGGGLWAVRGVAQGGDRAGL